MFTADPGHDLIALLIAGTSAALLGLALVLGFFSSSRRLVLAAMILLPAGLATWAPVLDDYWVARWPLLALAAACAGCLYLSTGAPQRLIAAALRLAGRPRVQGVALLGFAVLLLIALPWMFEKEADRVLQMQVAYADNPVAAERHKKQVTAWTDRGAPISAFEVGEHLALADERAAEAQLAESHNLGLHLIRTAPPDGACNCHGWVFAGGRYLIDSGDVDRIVQDNGYDVVATPQVGDLVLYRFAGAGTAHSAVVRVADDEGLILLESKWNTLGRYLHRPEDYAPGAIWTYYRSPRSGHVLRGLDPHDSSPGESPVVEQHAPQS